MERQKPLPPIFEPEQIDEQIDYLTGIRDTRTRDEIPGAPTIAALRRLAAENETILEHVWQQLAHHEESWRMLEDQGKPVDLALTRQRKDETMSTTDAMPQLNTLDAEQRPTSRHRRRLFALVAALLAIVIIGSFATILSLTHTSTPSTGSPRQPASPTAQSTLPVPSNQVLWADQRVIASVGLSNKEVNGQISTFVNKFTVGQTIYLVCGANTAHEKAPGTISVKWYIHDQLYRTDPSFDPIQPRQSVAAVFHIAYTQPAEGRAEIYWNNKLAATVFFVVEPASA